MNVLGAGDAFMAGLLKGWLTGASWREAARMANACGALVVARHACSASMPTPDELEYFMARPGLDRPDQDAHLARLHARQRQGKRWDDLAVLAFDHRASSRTRPGGGAPEIVPDLKRLLVARPPRPRKRWTFKATSARSSTAPTARTRSRRERARLWLGAPGGSARLTTARVRGWRSIGSRLPSWPREQV